MTTRENPKMRLVDAQPITYEGEAYLYLRDPLALSEKTLLVPQPYIPLLSLCDGVRNVGALKAALAFRYGVFLTNQRIDEFINALDDALLLDNERSRQARHVARDEYRTAAFRIPASAGASYPEDPQELAGHLQGYIDGLDGQTPTQERHVRGLISPHIDYERGGPVYAQVWSAAAKAAREAEIAIILGTDHFSEGFPFTLTRQNYATPFGTIPTHQPIVDDLARAIGPELAFEGELHHRREHSIELAAVWMHHMRGGQPFEMVPILCGSLDTTLRDHPQQLEEVIHILQRVVKKKRTLVVAAGDMAHVGPAFGGDPVDAGKLKILQQADQELIQAMCRCDAAGFYQSIEKVNDANNVCGISPIYLTLRLLSPSNGKQFGYAVCPADENQTSVVSICGVTLQ